MLNKRNSLISIVMALTCSMANAATEVEPATISFNGGGFYASAPSGATQLEVRVADPARNVVFEKRTEGESITWTLSGNEGDGEYRYEAVVVKKIGGKFKQNTTAGGFEVQGGLVIPPPEPTSLPNAR